MKRHILKYIFQVGIFDIDANFKLLTKLNFLYEFKRKNPPERELSEESGR